MDSDEVSAIDDPEDAKWVAEQRQIVIDYLASQRCNHAGVSLEPRWFLSPYLAVWAVRSRADPERIGWWAVSGDVPTDYMTCTTEQDAGDVLLTFSSIWRAAAERMAKGEQLQGHRFGDPARARELAPLLRTRSELLRDLAGKIKSGELP